MVKLIDHKLKLKMEEKAMKSFYFIILSFAFFNCSSDKSDRREIEHPKGTEQIVFEAQYGSSENPDDHIYCELRHFQKGSEDSIIAFYKRNNNYIMVNRDLNFYYSDSVIQGNADQFSFYKISKKDKQKIGSNFPFYVISY